jgi:hypothetical protein
MIDPEVLIHATPKQAKYLQAVEEHGSYKNASAAVGIDSSVIAKAVKAAIKKAELKKKFALIKNTVRKAVGIKILVLPDVQAKDGINFDYLAKIGQYAVDKKPDVIVCIGDFADMPSLSSYDKGKKSFEGRRFKLDIESAKNAMFAFLTPMWDYNKANPMAKYQPRMVMTLGNHEDRITRAVNDDPKLEGLISIEKSLEYHVDGWEVHPFLEVVEIEGIAFSHYFQTGVMGRPSSSAQAQLNKKHQSCIAGHQQGLQIASGFKATGQMIWSIIIGSCYEHNEDYLGPQGNKHWRGFLMLHDCQNGAFDPMFVSLNYINSRYPDLVAA